MAPWLMYWVVISGYTAVEAVSDTVLFWLIYCNLIQGFRFTMR